MKTFTESVIDLNAIKEERAHSRVTVPESHQVDANYRLMAEVLEGTGIDQSEIAGIAIDVGASAAHAVLSAEHLTAEDLMGIFAGVWADAVAQTAHYLKQREAGEGE